MGLCIGTVSAQFGGIVYDPTSYRNAVLRYLQLPQQFAQLRQTYTEIMAQYNLTVQMARTIQSIPAHYCVHFSQWRNVVAQNAYGNTGYQQATNPALQYNGQLLAGMTRDELHRIGSQ